MIKTFKFRGNKKCSKNTKMLQIKEKYEMQKKHITDKNNPLIVIDSKELLKKLQLESRNLMLETNNFIQICDYKKYDDNTVQVSMLKNVIEEINSLLTFFPLRRRNSIERLHYNCRNF